MVRNLNGTSREEDAKRWLIAYTFPKAERKIHSKLEAIGVTSFLPLQKVIRKWSDRNKKLIVPLFPNYIFIHTCVKQQYEILQLRELVRYVEFAGKLATVSENLIGSLKKMVAGDVEVSNENFISGMRVRICEGPLMGTEGVLLRRNGKKRLLVRIEALQRCVSVDISANSVVSVL
jgi:transcription antitermination factor NusG